MSPRLNVTDSRLVLLCHNSGQEHFYQGFNTEPWCLSELICTQFQSMCMFLDGSPLKRNELLTMTLLKCCYKIYGIECSNAKKCHYACIHTDLDDIWLTMSRCRWPQGPQVLRRPAVWNWPAHVQNREKSHSCAKTFYLVPSVEFFHSAPRHTSSSACYTHILLLISTYFNI